VRPLRLGPTALDLLAIGVGATLTALFAKRASEAASLGSLVPLLALLFFLGLVTLTVAAPHWLVAGAIPVFAAIPMLKVLATPWIGPLKDAVTIAAAVGAAILVVRRRNGHEGQRGDQVVLIAVAAFLGLYVLNLGEGFGPNAYNDAWAQGVRLAAEPLMLLVVGLTLSNAQQTYRWAMRSLIATTLGCALVGLWQQYVGQWRLVDMGYEFDVHVRTLNGRLRSFGTLDDSFAYAAFLLFGIVAVVFFLRRSPLAVGLLLFLVGGLAVAYVRTSAIILVALAGLWLARHRHHAAAAFVLVAACAGGIALLAGQHASQTQVVQAGTNTYLTINGRTSVWKQALGGPSDWLAGRGVGEVGTAAQRASFGVVRTANPSDAPSSDNLAAVDSGYLAAVVDVGVIGLIVLLALVGRLCWLATRDIRDGLTEGWVALGLMVVILLDAVTRASFNGFPTAFLGLLVVGVALNAADEERRERGLPARA
jgi:hypothetical protein